MSAPDGPPASILLLAAMAGSPSLPCPSGPDRSTRAPGTHVRRKDVCSSIACAGRLQRADRPSLDDGTATTAGAGRRSRPARSDSRWRELARDVAPLRRPWSGSAAPPWSISSHPPPIRRPPYGTKRELRRGSPPSPGAPRSPPRLACSLFVMWGRRGSPPAPGLGRSLARGVERWRCYADRRDAMQPATRWAETIFRDRVALIWIGGAGMT